MNMIRANFSLKREAFSLDCKLALPASGVSILFGPSGSGKTTLLKCLAGLLKTSGHCVFKQKTWQDDGSSLFVPPYQRNIGFVFQEANLFPHLNVYDNLVFGLKFRTRLNPTQKVAEISELLGINHLLQRMPDKLSGGERQRVAIARAIVSQPELLLLDEPLASLDFEAKREILRYLENLKNTLKIPMIYVSHVTQEFLRLADYVVLIEKGAVVNAGTFDQLGNDFFRQQNALGAIVSGKVCENDSKYFLSKIDCQHNELFLPGIYDIGRTLYLQILAKDVSLVKEKPSDSSILNILPAKIISIAEDQEAVVVVKLDCSGMVLYSAITKKSRDFLGLHQGLNLFAQIKSISLDFALGSHTRYFRSPIIE